MLIIAIAVRINRLSENLSQVAIAQIETVLNVVALNQEMAKPNRLSVTNAQVLVVVALSVANVAVKMALMPQNAVAVIVLANRCKY